MDKVARWDLVIHQGSTWVRTLELPEINVEFFGFRSYIKRSHTQRNPVGVFQFAPVQGNANQVEMSLSAQASAQLPAGRLVYDIEMFTPNDEFVSRIIEGRIRVTPEVTTNPV